MTLARHNPKSGGFHIQNQGRRTVSVYQDRTQQVLGAQAARKAREAAAAAAAAAAAEPDPEPEPEPKTFTRGALSPRNPPAAYGRTLLTRSTLRLHSRVIYDGVQES